MTIATTSASTGLLPGNGVTTVWNIPYVIDQAADLLVYFVDATGTATLLNASQYTLFINATPVGGLWGIGGFVTYPTSGTPIATGTSMVINRAVPYQQTVSITNQGAFAPQSTEQALDILELEIQQLVYAVSQTLQVPVGSNLTPLQYIESLISQGSSSPFTGNISTISSASYVVGPADVTLLVNAGVAAVSITLPSPSANPGRILNVKKIDITSHVVSFVGMVDRSSNYALISQYQSATLQSNGTGWFVL